MRPLLQQKQCPPLCKRGEEQGSRGTSLPVPLLPLSTGAILARRQPPLLKPP